MAHRRSRARRREASPIERAGEKDSRCDGEQRRQKGLPERETYHVPQITIVQECRQIGRGRVLPEREKRGEGHRHHQAAAASPGTSQPKVSG